MKMLLKTAAVAATLACVFSAPAFAKDEDELFKSGLNLYIKLAGQDDMSVPNQHPVTLNPVEISNALRQLRVWEKNWFKPNEAETVFSTEQARLLGQYVALGLAKAGPNQDIVFALSRRDPVFLGIKELSYTSGRIFYAGGKLNVIMGDYRRAPDKFMERAQASAGVTEIKYYFANGKRSKSSGFDKAIVTGAGLDVQTSASGRRPDWFIIDVPLASTAFLAENRHDSDGTGVDSEAARQEAARLAQERRELRLEMARMRKEMSEGTKTADTVEERLRALDDLKAKGLINDTEYQSKRKEILGDL